MSTTIRGLEDVQKLQGLLSEHQKCVEDIHRLDGYESFDFTVCPINPNIDVIGNPVCSLSLDELRLVLEARYKANATKLANHGINVKPYEAVQGEME